MNRVVCPAPALSERLWPEWREPARQQLRRMWRELEGLSVTGWEASVRLSPAGIEAGRWLAGFSPLGVARDRLLTLPERLGLPAPVRPLYEQGLRQARQIYLGLDQTEADVVAKVYLESALPAPELRRQPARQRHAALHIQGYKWSLTRSLPHRLTEYWRLSGLDGSAMVELVRAADGVPPASRSAYRMVAQVLAHAIGRDPAWHGFRLLLVREPASPRCSIGVRLYGSQLRAGVLAEGLLRLGASWGLAPEALKHLITVWADHELGWLHAGTSAEGQPFLIFYCALNHAQARAALTSAGISTSLQAFALPEN